MDGKPPRLTGEPVQVADGVRSFANHGYADFSLSRNVTIIHLVHATIRALPSIRFDKNAIGGFCSCFALGE